MNKKFLVGALLVALSTAGYAYDKVKGTWLLGGMSGVNNNFTAVQNDVNNINNSLAGKVDQGDFDSLKTQVSNNTATTTTNSQLIGNLTQNLDETNKEIDSVKGDVDFVKGEVERVEGEVTDLQNKVEAGFDNLQNQVSGNSQALGELGQDIVDLNKDVADLNAKSDANDLALENAIKSEAMNRENQDKVLDGKIQENKDAIADLNAKSDANDLALENAIKSEAMNRENQDKVLDGKIQENKDAIADLNAKSDANDLALENAIKSEAMNRENQDKVLNNKIEENKKEQAETDKKQDQALKDETTAREEADKALDGRIDTLQQNFAQYDGRLSGLEKKVDHLDDKMNKGLSLMAAMNAVDFQNVQTGEMALGAGIGHYGNAQSVALGVAYAPVEDLTVNAKYSITAGDPDSFAVGAGATYKFKVGR